MWQAPNQRLRAQANAKKRERDRYKVPFHIKRVVASVKLQIAGQEPRQFEARALLNDFSPRGMGLFSAHLFSQGDEIIVSIETPEKIEVKGRIAWCQEYFVVGKVLKSQSFSYRAGVQFTFASAEEEEAVKKFCEMLLHTHHCVSLRHDPLPEVGVAADKDKAEKKSDQPTVAAEAAALDAPGSPPAPDASAPAAVAAKADAPTTEKVADSAPAAADAGTAQEGQNPAAAA